MKVSLLANKLKKSYNLILRGPPGTGKTYMAKELAAEIIGIAKEKLVESEQFEFVQFHPSYDYTDFIEGLRPVQINGTVGFEPKNGIFKEFCNKARMHQESKFEIFENIWENFISNIEENGSVTISIDKDKKKITSSTFKNHCLKVVEEFGNIVWITKENMFRVWQGKDIDKHDEKRETMMELIQLLKDDYDLPEYQKSVDEINTINDKKFVFVIDEINRGVASRIMCKWKIHSLM